MDKVTAYVTYFEEGVKEWLLFNENPFLLKVSLKGCDCWKNLFPLSENKNSAHGVAADQKGDYWNW